MQKPLLFCVALMAASSVNAQISTGTVKAAADTQNTFAGVFGGIGQYNHWSVGLNAGVTNPVVPFTVNAVNHNKPALGYGASVRDQLSHSFGLELNYAAGKVKGDDIGSEFINGVKTAGDFPKFSGDAFHTSFNQVTLSGIFNFGSLSFGHRTNAVDFYGSAGAGVIFYKPKFNDAGEGAPAGSNYSHQYTNNLKVFVVPVGAGVKFRLSEALALNVGYNINFVDGYNLSGFSTYPATNHYAYSYAGLAYTFGSGEKKNVDWVNPVAMLYDTLYDAALREEVSALKARITTVENAFADLKKDSDGDGVADQFDKCPGTPAGNVVDGSGCPMVLPEADTVITRASPAAAVYGNIQFDFKSSVLKTSSYPVLDATAADMRSSGRSIMLNGYSSADEGNKLQALELSKDRAAAVKIYLVNSGIPSKVIQINGFGNKPIAPNETEEGRAINRRVEFGKFDSHSQGTLVRFDNGKAIIKNPETLSPFISALRNDKNTRLILIARSSGVETLEKFQTSAPDKYQALSEQRKKAVVNYLIKNGFPAAHIQASAVGNRQPYGDDDNTGFGQANNRSVEVRIK